MERERVLEATCDPAVPEASLHLNARQFPAMAKAAVTETWGGLLTATPDNIPIASAVPRIPGLYLLTGCSYGFTWGPAMGRMMAELMTGRPTTLDHSMFRLERFFDGSPIRLTH